jgi:hypothetical protein
MSARADTAPPAGVPATVSADALPTVQLNGVVWAQAMVGNTVYVAGQFTETWPAGLTNSAANDTARSNLLAYDITTGNLIASFNHSLNAQSLALAVSPDKSRVYVGGDFTTVDGKTHNHIVAFDTATGAVDPTFDATVSGQVRAIAPTNTTVYVGGSFTKVGSAKRDSLAAFSAADGSLLPTWSPSVEQPVWALVLTPDQSEVVIGGAFVTLNGANVYGLGAVSAASGVSVSYAADKTIQDYRPLNAPSGDGAAITSLTTDGTQIYGSGYSYNEGNFEGTFGLDPDTGAINWIDDCHGDTYSVQPIGPVLYSASHVHDCSGIGAFPDTNPRVNHHALAEVTTASTAFNQGPDTYGWNYSKFHDTALLQWFPSFTIGAVTGQSQATWSVTGNSTYVSYGGEFPDVNGKAQAGLARFAIPSVAPDKVGPTYNATALTPKVTAVSSTSAKLTWSATSDMDNNALSYQVYRDGAGPIYTTTVDSSFWSLPAMSFTDTGLAAGSTHTYVIRVYDANGNTTNGNSASVTLPGGGGGGSGGTSTSASDDFARAVTGGWGTTTSGQAWTTASPGSISVNGSQGVLTMTKPSSGPSAYLTSFASTSTDTTATVSANALATAANGISLSTVGRSISSGTDYRALVHVLSNNTVTIALQRESAGVPTTLAGEMTLPGVTFTPNLALDVRLQVTGTSPTTLALKVWPAGQTEPTSWQLTTTDDTAALQVAGTVGFASYLGGGATNAPVNMTVDDFATGP